MNWNSLIPELWSFSFYWTAGIAALFTIALIILIIYSRRTNVAAKTREAILQTVSEQVTSPEQGLVVESDADFRWLLSTFLCDTRVQNNTAEDTTVQVESNAQTEVSDTETGNTKQVIPPVNKANKTLVFQFSHGYAMRSSAQITQVAYPLETLAFMPALLTSLGIIGTFIGIVSGIGDVSLDMQSDALLKDIKKLLGGMTTAFQTSLAGLGLAAFYMLLNADHQRVINGLNKRFARKLENMSILVNPIDFLKGFDPQKQREALDVQKALGDQFKTLVSGFDSKAMGAAIGQNIREVMQEDFTPAFTNMASELSELNKTNKNNNKELIDLLTQSLKDEIIAPIAVQISSIASTVEKTNDSIQTLSTELDQVVDKLSTTVSRLTEFQPQTVNDLSSFASNLQTILKDFEQTMSVAMRETAKSSSDLIIAASQELQTGLGDIDKKINMIKDTLQHELETFRLDYQKNLNSFFDQQNNNLDRLFNHQKDGLEQVIIRFKSTFEADLSERSKITEELVHSAQIVQRLSRDVNMLQEAELGHLVDAINKNQHAVNDINKASQDAYNHIEKSVSQFSSYVDMFFEKNVSSSTAFFSQLDDAASKIARTLLEGANAQISADRLRNTDEAPESEQNTQQPN